MDDKTYLITYYVNDDATARQIITASEYTGGEVISNNYILLNKSDALEYFKDFEDLHKIEKISENM
jgi:hypothetical protein